MREAQEIEDEGHEQILERVCAIDVAKASEPSNTDPTRTDRDGPKPRAGI